MPGFISLVTNLWSDFVCVPLCVCVCYIFFILSFVLFIENWSMYQALTNLRNTHTHIHKQGCNLMTWMLEVLLFNPTPNKTNKNTTTPAQQFKNLYILIEISPMLSPASWYIIFRFSGKLITLKRLGFLYRKPARLPSTRLFWRSVFPEIIFMSSTGSNY